MQFRQLEYFVEVADSLSFTSAASRLHVVQSGVSAAIRALERELGTPLFERTTQGLRLTDAGRLFVPEAQATLEAAQRAADTVVEARAGLRGRVRLGVLISVAIVDVPSSAGRFHRSHPGVELQISSGSTAQFLDALARHDLDAALVSPSGVVPDGIRLQRLGSAPFVALLPRSHHLAARSEVGIEELAAEEFIDSPSGFGNRDQLDTVFATRGLARTVRTEIPDVATAEAYVRNGLGIAIVPMVTQRDLADVAVVPLSGSIPPWDLFLATRVERHPALAVEALIETFLADIQQATD